MTIEKFGAIYQRAAERKGGKDQLEALLTHPLSKTELAAIPDDRWLAAFSMKVFQSGISWSVVRKKWPNFEEVFLVSKSSHYLCFLTNSGKQKRQTNVSFAT